MGSGDTFHDRQATVPITSHLTVGEEGEDTNIFFNVEYGSTELKNGI